jgi:hypothetical protein
MQTQGNAARPPVVTGLTGLFTAALLLVWTLCAGTLAADAQSLGSSPVILLLIEDRGCPYCARWDRDVGPGYARSPEGQFAPLVRRYRGSPDVSFLDGVVFSPTFLVLKDGKEVGRIVGYAGPDFFWSELSALLAKAGFPPAKS